MIDWLCLDEKDIDSLKVELNSLLHELDSVYADSLRIHNVTDRLNILHCLAGDLFASRIDYIKNFDVNSEQSNELNPRKDLTIINNCLQITDDFGNIKTYFLKVKERLCKCFPRLNEEDSLLLPEGKQLSLEQWDELKKLNELLRDEYSLRRDLMLRRAQTTMNAFCWKQDSSREADEQHIKKIYSASSKKLSKVPSVTLSHSLAARNSDCKSLIHDMISTSHANCLISVPTFGKANQGAQQRLQLHKFLIGAVPDRGGRPDEQPAPPKETITQQRQRETRGRGGNRGASNRGDYRGGGGAPRNNQQTYVPEHSNRIQNAGWQQGGYNDRGGYHSNRRGNQEDYSQYEGGYNRNSGGYRQDDGYHSYGRRGRGRGGGGGRGNRY